MRAILTYHSVDPSGSPISVTVDQLRAHVAWFASGAVEVVALADLQRVPAERDALAVTFDDGFRNFAELAWPLFREHGLPVTLFVPTQCVGGTNAWGGVDEAGIPTLPLCDWDALGRMADEGLELGAHGRTHRRMSMLADGELAGEVDGPAEDIRERTGARPGSFCYPYGDLDGRSGGAVAAAYDVAVTTELRAIEAGDAAHLLPRLDAYYYREGERLASWGSSSFRRHLWVRATARRVRRALNGG